MKHLWASRSTVQPGMDQAFDLSAIQQHPTYQAVLSSGILADGNEWLLERAVREMDKAARAYSPNVREHIVRGGKILYKIEGRDEYGPWAFDYETNAEYLAAYDSGNLDLQQLKEGLIACMIFASKHVGPVTRPRGFGRREAAGREFDMERG